MKLDVLKRLDAYPKTFDELSFRSMGGAIVTIISTIIIITLILLELNAHLMLDVTEELFVDTTRNHKLKINLNITVPRISCDYLSLDAMDTTGDQHLHIEHNIFKKRLDLEGKMIPDAMPEKHDVSKVTTKKDDNKGNSTGVAKVECGSCYGANRTCCNTCQEVIDAYRDMRWEPKMEEFVQCKDKLSLQPAEMKEGCLVYGHMEVNRMGGSFHIAPGKSFSINHIHVHDVHPYSSSSFNTSHTINHLSFGDPMTYAKTHPLDEIEVETKEGAMMFQYYIKIVPTMLEKETGDLIFSNQFSVTRHQKSVSASSGESGMPGVFFSYELSPLMVKYTEKTKPLGHFLTSVCGIVGGIYTVTGILYTILDNSFHAIKTKMDLGKFS